MINLFKYILFFLAVPFVTVQGQTGLSVSPPRTYVVSNPGEIISKKILVTNTSKNAPLNLTVSLSDWQYDTAGNNLVGDPGTLENSASSWISVKPQSYFTVLPGETHEMEIMLNVPQRKGSSDIHTSLIFVTQTNPVDSFNERGAVVKVSMQSGIKIYHRYDTPANPSIEFTDYRFNKETKNLELALENTGNIWTDGTVITELVNLNTGTKHKLEDQIIYTLPADKRKVTVPLPKGLKPGKYTASSVISYGDDDTIKMAELGFVYE
ncbi:molecular chaperone [Kaistella sp. PBT33-4]|uniref:fimbrial biogenesis chaperone n=1 Tax=Kaistella sp. PBT33-4 TaxID=3032000 RepID=UPI0023D82701|nr:molecular chaperone [Kaistella sp. PBT33-4]MDF0720929.1 molecular chaperone [Kaistella sp. PBT33-4]